MGGIRPWTPSVAFSRPREYTVLSEGGLAMPDDTQAITLMQTARVTKNVGSLPTFQMRPASLRMWRRENSRNDSARIVKKLRALRPEVHSVSENAIGMPGITKINSEHVRLGQKLSELKTSVVLSLSDRVTTQMAHFQKKRRRQLSQAPLGHSAGRGLRASCSRRRLAVRAPSSLLRVCSLARRLHTRRRRRRTVRRAAAGGSKLSLPDDKFWESRRAWEPLGGPEPFPPGTEHRAPEAARDSRPGLQRSS